MTTKKRVIIIDDEVDAQQNLQWMIEQFCPDLEIIDIADNVKSGLEILQQNPVDLIFLDIDLPDGTGFDFIKKASPLTAEVIFVTGEQKHAVKAFEFSAIGYILKPIDPDLLKASVAKVQSKLSSYIDNRVSLLLENYQKKTFSKIALPSLESIEIVDTKDILYCEANDAYTLVHLNNDLEKLVVSKNIGALEKLLPDNFFRVHKSFLVNLATVKRFLKTDGGEIVPENGLHVPVAKRRKDDLILKLSHF